jgi:O-methyltransferase involved in polyketide biosynthesis
MEQQQEKQSLGLQAVPETMLWTLHNRAGEALREDGFIKDPEAVRIYQSIDYDYERSFGKVDGSHAVRSRIFDEAVGKWMQKHSGGNVVELGCGLETQFQRIDDGKVKWWCIDVPEAIAVRERFLPAGERMRHVPKSALDTSWIDELDPNAPTFITAQGLFMYFEEQEVIGLIKAMTHYFKNAELMFDYIPKWFSKKTCSGLKKTEHYTVPCMPWGIARDDMGLFLRSISSDISSVQIIPYDAFRGPFGVLFSIFSKVPVLRNLPPGMVRAHIAA